MLFSDGYLAGMPTSTNPGKRRGQDVDVNSDRVESGCESGLDDCPRSTLVAGKQPIF